MELLTDGKRLQQILAAGTNITGYKEQFLRHLVLHAQVPLLNIRRLEIAIDRAKLERLGNVSRRSCDATSVNCNSGVVADHVGASHSRSAGHAKRQPVAKP